MYPTDDEILSCFPETLEEAREQGLYVNELYKKIKQELKWKSGRSYVDDKTVRRRIAKLSKKSFRVWQAHPADQVMIKKYGGNKRYYYKRISTKSLIYGMDLGVE